MISVGFLIRYKTTRKKARQKFLAHVESLRNPSKPPQLYTKLPCGMEYTLSYDDFPTVSRRCDCGDVSHWVVKYERFNPGAPTPISSNSPSLFPPDRGQEGEEKTGPETLSEGPVSDIEGHGV